MLDVRLRRVGGVRWVLAAVVAAMAGAVLLAGAPRAVATAADAAWTANPSANEAASWRELTWVPELASFVAVGSTGAIMTSPDGVTWTSQVGPSTNLHSVTWSPALGLLVAVGGANAGANSIITSPDGVTWTAQAAPPTQTTLALSDVTWSPERSQLVAVAATGGSMTSADGVTWVASSAPTQPTVSHDVVWMAELGLYVAASNSPSGASQHIYTSPDGATWTEVTAVPAGLWRSAAYSPTADRAVVVGVNGIITSPDGVTWTAQTTPVTDLRAVTWSPENGEFVALGSAGVVSSPDGVTWTSVVSPAANSWESVVWSAALSRYVGTATAGTDRVLVGLVFAVPGAPIGLTAIVSDDAAALSWTAPTFDGNAPITGYRIERSIDGAAFAVLVADTGSLDTTYDDSDVEPGSAYTYRVVALNSVGGSAASNEATVEFAAPELAATGPETSPVGFVGLALVVAGAALLMRRPRPRQF